MENTVLLPLLPALDSGLDSAWVKARLDSARDRCSGQGSFLGSRLDDTTWLDPRLGLARGPAQLETQLIAARDPGHLDSAWLGSTRLRSAG